MQANACSCICNPNLANSQPQSNNLQTNRNNNQRSTSFNANNGLSSSSAEGDVVTGLVIVLIQLLMQQLGNRQNQDQQSGQNGNTPQLNFSNNDKGLLLNAIGVGANAGTQVNRVDDVDGSANLNGGDNIELQTNANLANHNVTDAESRRFIELRNPPGTVKLPLSAQQSSLLESRYNADNVTIADNNADSQISVGDFLTGFQTQGDRLVQIDIPVDAALVALLNA